MGSAAKPRALRFGGFEVDPVTEELRKEGLHVRLPTQSIQVLLVLLETPGELVRREELHRRLWPEDTFVDFDHGLNAAVTRLREALGDSADRPKFIETLPRRGYRFIAPIEGVGEICGAVTQAPGKSKVGETRQSWLRRHRWDLALPVALIASAAAFFALDVGGLRNKLLHPSPSAATEPQIRTLAVLPLTNLSGDPEQEYFADGMTEEFISELSRIPSLKVISRTSVMQYKGEKKKSLSQIGRELHVDAVMEGSVLRSGNRVRIAAHVIYAPTDQSLTAETYEGDLGDVLKLQRDVANSITEKIRAKLTPEQQSRLQQAPKVDSQAYDAFLMATYQETTVYQGNKEAQDYLQKAIQKDPNFASAYSLLAWTYFRSGEFLWQAPREVYPSAKQAAGKALELDETDCRAHQVLGLISWRYDWEWQTAEKEFSQAIELCPNSPGPHRTYGLYLATNGRIAEAQTEAIKLRELDPILSEPLNSEAIINYHLRNYKALVEVCRKYTASRPNLWLAHYWLGVGLEGSGQAVEAIPEYQRAVELSQGHSDPTASLAHAYATTGKRAETEKILNHWLRQSETSYVSPYMIAAVYAGLGDKNSAFEYLEKAYEQRSSDLPYQLRADLRVDNLRSDPRFQDLVRRMNFPK